MADTGFSGDPYHEGGSQPMAHLRGGCTDAPTQAPMSGENSGKSQGNANDTSGNITSWESTTLAPGHPTTGANDGNKAH